MNKLFCLVLLAHTSACANRTPATLEDKTISSIGKPDKVAIPATAKKDSFQTGKVIDTIFCRDLPSESYALYIPVRSGNSTSGMPVVYFFDPHAAGCLPLDKYKGLADEYGFILVGSNTSKNGNDWLTSENIWKVLYKDTKARLNINEDRIYLCGFSGGARVAGYVALQHPFIRGVIANSAGLPEGATPGTFSFSYTALAGEGDMNMTEVVAASTALDKTRTRHRLILFDGIHEWAPAASMDLAFAGLQFDAMVDGLLPKDDMLIGQFSAKSKKRVEAYSQTRQLIRAEEETKRSINMLAGLTPEMAWFQDKAAAIDKNPLYKKQLHAQDSLLFVEQGLKGEYMQHFQVDDAPYWDQTINGLKAKVKANAAGKDMYQRLLAYLSLAFYSFSNQLINAGDNTNARRYVELYKQADPTNSEAWYFSALLDARGGNAQTTEADLRKAISLGFNDKTRLAAQSEFKSLLSPDMLARLGIGKH